MTTRHVILQVNLIWWYYNIYGYSQYRHLQTRLTSKLTETSYSRVFIPSVDLCQSNDTFGNYGVSGMLILTMFNKGWGSGCFSGLYQSLVTCTDDEACHDCERVSKVGWTQNSL